MARNTLYPPSVKPGIPKLGIKPEGWIETTFGDVLRVVQRPANIENNVEYQLVTAKRARGGIVPRETLNGQKILTKIQYYVATDDFLISKRQIVHGACGVVPPTLDGALVSGEYSVLRVKDGLLLKYLDYFSHTDYFQMACFQASVGVDVEKMIFDLNDWLKTKIYLPLNLEQQKIVNILCIWDEAITKTERLIDALRERKKGLMQRLLTGQVRFTGFKGEWRQVHLREILKNEIGAIKVGPFGSQLKKDELVKEGYKVYGQENVYQNDFNIGERYLNERQFQALKSCEIVPGDFLITMMGTIGKCAIVPENIERGIQDSHLMRLHVNENMYSKRFLAYLFQSYELNKQVKRQSVGGIMEGLSSQIVQGLKLPLPSVEEQERIADILESCDLQISTLRKLRECLQNQKRGLMQRLLTGEVRVKA